MRTVGIIVNVLFAVLAVIIIYSGVCVSSTGSGVSVELHDKLNIVIALLLLIVSLLFSQVYCSGGKK